MSQQLVAAASGEAPVPLAAACWASLPCDLVRLVADCFLDTNDVDWYMDLRAVCHSWRAATDDPRNSTTDGRFRPLEWIVLDDGVTQSDDDDMRVFVNTVTGRGGATTFGGYFVLADRSPPHAACVLNPFTGELVRFAAPVPRDAVVAVFFFADNSPHNLMLFCDSSREFYKAVPDSKSFIAHSDGDDIYNFMRKAVVGGAFANGGGWASVASPGTLETLCVMVEMLQVDIAKFFSGDPFWNTNDIRCFFVDFGRDAMVITQSQRGRVVVLEVEPEEEAIVPVRTIGEYAIFIGHHRCMVVDADKFPSVHANCVYYTLQSGPFAWIWKHNIADGTLERVSEDVDFVMRNNKFDLCAYRPFTIIQVLCSYTINLRGSELALQEAT